MKKYIVSDLHGCGDIYYSLMNYLDNIAKEEEVKLYINGDLIDRGKDSFIMLEDVYNRMMGDKFVSVNYLGGNHELMMYESLLYYKEYGRFPLINNWIMNGGSSLIKELYKVDKDFIERYISFIGNLDIYKVFEEKILDKRILLVHAKAPKKVRNICDMKIRDDDRGVFKAVWTRSVDEFHIKHKLGNKKYFTIIGHTPVKSGFYYNRDENYLNIDGGCSGYALGYKDYSKVAVVEVEDGRISILQFNHNNMIVDGYYFDGFFSKMSCNDIKIREKYLRK